MGEFLGIFEDEMDDINYPVTNQMIDEMFNNLTVRTFVPVSDYRLLQLRFGTPDIETVLNITLFSPGIDKIENGEPLEVDDFYMDLKEEVKDFLGRNEFAKNSKQAKHLETKMHEFISLFVKEFESSKLALLLAE